MLSISRTDCFDAFKQIEPEWQRLALQIRELEPSAQSFAHVDNFYLSYDWFSFFLENFDLSDKQFCLLMVRDSRRDGALIAVMPLLMGTRRQRGFNYRTLELLGNTYSAYRGCLVVPGMEREVATRLVAFLSDDMGDEWDIMSLLDWSPNTPVNRCLEQELMRYGHRIREQIAYPNYVTDLSGCDTSEAFHKQLSRNFRRIIAKGINQMNRYGSFEILMLDREVDALESVMDDYYTVYSRSWKEEELDKSFHRKLVRRFIGQDCIRVFILYFKPADSEQAESEASIPSYDCDIHFLQQPPAGYQPIASYLAVTEGHNVFGLKTAYDEAFGKYSPGIVLMWFMFRHFLDQGGFHSLDHQKGGESFKQSFMGVKREDRRVLTVVNNGSLSGKCGALLNDLMMTVKKLVRPVVRGLRAG